MTLHYPSAVPNMQHPWRIGKYSLGELLVGMISLPILIVLNLKPFS